MTPSSHRQSGQEALGSGPALVGANWYRFVRGERIRHSEVASICFIWPVQGSGTVTTTGRSFPLGADDVLRLPWRHDVDYLADSRDPFHVGTVHVVPHHDETPTIDPRVGYRADDPLLRSPLRHGPPEPEEPLLLSRLTPSVRRLVELATFAVDRFHTGDLSSEVLRAYGTLLMDAASDRSTAAAATDLPVAMRWMTSFVTENLHRPLTLGEIAAAGDCSVATAQRLFSRHTGQSVIAWTRSRRLQHAAHLLRTTGLRVGEVAGQVGFADPLYFSRAFHEAFGVPPRRYASSDLRP
jgi:AraC-like DNA-binding protein